MIFLNEKPIFFKYKSYKKLKAPMNKHMHTYDEQCELDPCQVFIYNQTGWMLKTLNFLFKMVHHTLTTMIKLEKKRFLIFGLKNALAY
jgi:hypothetical protein